VSVGNDNIHVKLDTRNMTTIHVLALDGLLDSSLAIALDALRTAEGFRARSGKGSTLHLEVIGHRKTIRTGGGLRLDTTLSLRDALERDVRPDWLIVPGLGVTSVSRLIARLGEKDARLAMELLRKKQGARKIGASCSSVFLLAEAGVLAGHDVTTTWWLATAFRKRHPDIRLDETRMLVRDGRFLTAGSAFAQLDLVLAVITETMGAGIAQLCSSYMLIDHRPSQARYMIQSHVRHTDATVVAAERWIDANLARPVTVTDLASALALSPRTLARRISAATGVSPVRFLQRRRVMQAANLIETTTMSIEEVASRVGYQDGTALRKLIKREFGTTPAALRA
jgi:transcriptional regulator GlxA family with amidase domain